MYYGECRSKGDFQLSSGYMYYGEWRSKGRKWGRLMNEGGENLAVLLVGAGQNSVLLRLDGVFLERQY